ncbi:unnamed protein product, partial [Polarella glacialis]
TFFQCMREAWESMHHPLVDQVGYVQLSKTERVLWAELSARLPLYIAKKWQAASAGAKTVGFGRFAMDHLNKHAPRHEDDRSKFIKFLRAIELEAPPALLFTPVC